MNKVLIIDDEELTRNTFSEVLRQYNFSTLEACDGRSGISIFEKETPDAVLLDLSMPGMDGLETMQEMRKVDPDVPIIFLTAHGDIPTAVETVKMGAYDFIVKPPNLKMLVHAINKAVEQRRLRRERAAVGTQLLETEAANRELKREIAERLQAEEALRESQERLKLQFNSMPIGCILHDPDLLILDWNPAAEKIFGFKKEEVVGKSPVGLIVRDSVRPFVEVFLRDLKQGNHTMTGINENITKDGGRITCRWHDTPVRDASGSLIGIMAIAEDITERKKMKEALRESEAHYRAIIDSFDGFIYKCSHDYRVEYMNERFIRRTGRNAVGELCYNVMHDRDSVCPWCVNDRVFRGETVRWEVQSPKDNRWYYCVNTPLRHGDGSMSKQAMIIDITERKLAEEALKESENTYRTIFENTGAATVLLEEDGTISHANNKFEVLSGYSKEEIEGRKYWREFVLERDIERMNGYSRLRKIDPQAAPKSYEFHFIDRLDRIRSIALEVDVVHGTKKVVASLVDITERKLAEAALARYALEMKNLSSRLVDIQETERRHMARELHDEIGQALTGIKLNLEEHSSFPGKKTRKSLDEAQKMVSDLMDRVRDMSLSLRPSMLDDLGLLPTLLWHFRKYTAQTNIHITFKHSHMDSRFETEVETAAYRAVQEALTNVARHASTNKAEVVLMLKNNALEIYVRDRGKGFDPVAASARGNTAGLSGIRERAVLLGGQVTIESAPGAGTSLTVRIPLRERSPQKPSEDA